MCVCVEGFGRGFSGAFGTGEARKRREKEEEERRLENSKDSAHKPYGTSSHTDRRGEHRGCCDT